MGLFNWANVSEQKEGKGVDNKKEPALKIYFGVIRRKFFRFITLGSIYFVAGLPIWIFMACLAALLIVFHGVGFEIWFKGTGRELLQWVMLFCVPFIALISGPATMGVTYVLRNFSREQHAWGMEDMLEKASKNYVQGMLVSFINCVIVLLLFTLYIYYASLVQQGLHFMNYVIIVIALLFLCMRSYLYPMAVTYKVKTLDLYRYSMALAIMKFPQNLLLQIGSLACVYLAYRFNPVVGVGLTVIGGTAFMGYTHIFMVDRVLKDNMDEANLKQYLPKQKKVKK